MRDFDYLGENEVYLDAACQSLRPRPVIEAINNYYKKHNSCGERVKYRWGVETDEKVDSTREKVLKFLKLPPRKYTTSFTLNTTYGINLILSQLNPKHFKKVVTSEIEHNSPFLATMAFSNRTGLPREVIKRNPDGSIDLLKYDFTKAIVVVNCASNFDGRKLLNLKELIKKVHKQGGIIIVDAAQAMAHSSEVLHGTEPDAICFSAHKFYAPSLGVIVWHSDLLQFLEDNFLGGGMVDDVKKDSYILSATDKDHGYTRFEPGLQAWGEIVGLGASLDWYKKLTKKDWQIFQQNYTRLYDFLSSHPKIHLVNESPNPTLSFYIEGIDSHLFGAALSHENIMARTGYFCAHYYLDHVLNLPPLIRFSLGLHNRPEDIDKTIKILTSALGKN